LVEAGADFGGEKEFAFFVIADEQSAEIGVGGKRKRLG